MDPISLLAVVGLVFAGKTISDREEEPQQQSRKPIVKAPLTRRQIDLMAHPADHWADSMGLQVTTPDKGRRIGDWRLQPKDAVPNLQDMSRTNSRYPLGQPVYNLYDREYITNKMNNVSPLGNPHTVGPGLGLGPDVPAGGGFQDYFRALPVNINEEKLTTLEGREGPANPVVKNGGAAYIGDITHQAAQSKTAFRPPGAFGGGGAQSALVAPAGQPRYLKTEKTTMRDETGYRQDTLSDGPPSFFVQQPYAGGTSAYTDKALTRMSGDRSMPDRPANPSRMNVRNDPVNQVGAATQLRPEAYILPKPPMGPTGNNNSSGYVAPLYEDPTNVFKSIPNPRASKNFLDTAIQQLEKNPIAYSLAAPRQVDVN